jgi:hypothetical protein
MNSINDALIFNLKSAAGMLNLMTSDLQGSEWDHRAAPGANCAAWLVGHLILVERRALGHAGVTELPELPAGFETTFGREADAVLAKTFGDSSNLIPTFNKHRDLLIAAVAKLPASKIAESLPKPSARFSTFGEFFAFMGLHVTMHAGQISTIRRSLGRPALF